MEVAALIISICSFAFSTVIAIWNIVTSKRISDISLTSEFSKDIIKSYLKDRLPKAHANISFPEEKLSGVDELLSCLQQFMQDLRFLKYIDSRFYKKFKNSCQSLENYLTNSEDQKFDIDEQRSVTKNIYAKLNKIYKVAYKKYKNG